MLNDESCRQKLQRKQIGSNSSKNETRIEKHNNSDGKCITEFRKTRDRAIIMKFQDTGVKKRILKVSEKETQVV